MKKLRTTAAILFAIITAAFAGLSLYAQEAAEPHTETAGSDILVVYFSRSGENWEVGYIEKGNTQIVAELLAEKLGADLFRIETVMEYPEEYDEMLEVATAQREEDARPELKALPENLDDYQTIFLGYPIWWGGLPMPIYSFLESADVSGKVIYPFNTHGGSGVAGTDREIAAAVPSADVQDGFAVTGKTAQNDPDKTEELVDQYLAEIGK